MGYMGFGMRKEVYERKPVKRSLWSRARPKASGATGDPPSKEGQPNLTMKEIQSFHRWRPVDHLPKLNWKVAAAIVISVLVAAGVLYISIILVTHILDAGGMAF